MSRMPGYAPRDTLLVLDDGYTARGRLLGKPGTALGKLVFNTSMVGYQEILTDPSYAGEILVFTFPLIGIYGATLADAQSGGIHARGLIVGEAQFIPDSWRSDSTLSDLLLFEGITGISGLDTRRLARHLRDCGEMLGVITSELTEAEARSALDNAPDFGAVDYVKEVTGGAADWKFPIWLNSMLMTEPWDLIINIGHVVPHEVLGFANHNKNYFIGVGGKELICAAHMAAARICARSKMCSFAIDVRSC